MDSKEAIILIPGTWSGRAAWAREGSALRTALNRESCTTVLDWSRLNNHWARSRAVQKLRERVRGMPPDTDVYLIAHSHGGNIALQAAESPEISERIRGVCCLSTPFLHVWPRLDNETGRIARYALALSGTLALLVLLVPLLPWSWTSYNETVQVGSKLRYYEEVDPDFLRDFESWRKEGRGFPPTPALKVRQKSEPVFETRSVTHEVWLWTLVASTLAITVASAMSVYRLVKVLAKNSSGLSYSVPPHLHPRLLIIRSSGDEATAALAISQLLDRFLDVSWRVGAALTRVCSSILKCLVPLLETLAGKKFIVMTSLVVLLPAIAAFTWNYRLLGLVFVTLPFVGLLVLAAVLLIAGLMLTLVVAYLPFTGI